MKFICGTDDESSSAARSFRAALARMEYLRSLLPPMDGGQEFLLFSKLSDAWVCGRDSATDLTQTVPGTNLS